jgi:hypothetical protein
MRAKPSFWVVSTTIGQYILMESPFGEGRPVRPLPAATFPVQFFLYKPQKNLCHRIKTRLLEAFPVQFFLYFHKQICVMPKNRVLLAWIGHSDFRALAAESPAPLQSEFMPVVKGELPAAGEWMPILTLLEQEKPSICRIAVACR